MGKTLKAKEIVNEVSYQANQKIEKLSRKTSRDRSPEPIRRYSNPIHKFRENSCPKQSKFPTENKINKISKLIITNNQAYLVVSDKTSKNQPNQKTIPHKVELNQNNIISILIPNSISLESEFDRI